MLIGIGVASLIAFSAIACSADKPESPTVTPQSQGSVSTQPTQGSAATEPSQGMSVPPDKGIAVPPSQGLKGGGVTAGDSIGTSGSFASSGYETMPAILPGIPVRSRGYGYSAQESQNPTGLWVTGIGETTVKPDVALLSVGVESRAATVAEAREKAAAAMQAIITAVKAGGVAPDDISTQYYNIYPEYRYVEVRNPDGSYGKQELVGYIVNNTAQVKIRNLDNAGKVIDAAAAAGGDLVRINNIQFTVEDTSKFAAQMRELAAKDAKAKANVYALAFDLKVGGVLYLAELSSQAPVIQKDLAVARAAVAEGAPTPISADTMTLSTSIQVAFAISQ